MKGCVWKDENGLKSSVIHGISNPSSGAVRLATQRTHTCTQGIHRIDQGGGRKAWKRKEETSTDGGCTEDPHLQLLPSLATSEQFLWLPQMQFFTLVLRFPSPSAGLCIQCVSVELHYRLHSGAYVIPPSPRDRARYHQLQQREGQPLDYRELPHSSR